MKNLKLLFVVFTLFVFSASAAVFNPIKPTDKLRADIVNIIGPNCPYEYDKNECTAEVLFTINSNREIIVLSVTSPNEKAEPYLKNKLNYKKISYTPTRVGEIFLLPLRMVRKY
ncbi:MAG: hypothetical protein L3J34_06710 [Flavobacteriaceae bacterium]|nr:hypothetical protein [Flavobacteriaceae bacterium]